MNYTLLPSLKSIAMKKIAVILWVQSDIGDSIVTFNFSPVFNEREKNWQKLEEKVTDKVSKLPLSKLLKEGLSGSIKPLGFHIFKWIVHNKEYCKINKDILIDKDILNKLCWSSQGTIDEKKTAEVLIKDLELSVITRYKLACMYCLCDFIPELWSKITETEKQSLGENKNSDVHEKLIVYWTYFLTGKVNSVENVLNKWGTKCSPQQHAFEYVAFYGNKAATAYFLEVLSPKERDESLARSAVYCANGYCTCNNKCNELNEGFNTEVLLFLLLQMNKEQQVELFERGSFYVLKCFLIWPWQDYFIQMVSLTWEYLSKAFYNLLLKTVIVKIKEDLRDYDYKALFSQIWKLSPLPYKRYVISHSSSYYLLMNLFQIGDKKNLTLIINDGIFMEKKNIFFLESGQNIFRYLVFRGEWDFLKFLIKEFISSRDETMKFKQKFKRYLKMCCPEFELTKRKDNFKIFYALIDSFIYNNGKNITEEIKTDLECDVSDGDSDSESDSFEDSDDESNYDEFRTRFQSESDCPDSVFEDNAIGAKGGI